MLLAKLRRSHITIVILHILNLGPTTKTPEDAFKTVPEHTHRYFYRSVNLYTSAEHLQEETKPIKAHTKKSQKENAAN